MFRLFHLLNQLNRLISRCSEHRFKLNNGHPVKANEKAAPRAVFRSKTSSTSTRITLTNQQTTTKIKRMLIKMATLHFQNSLRLWGNYHRYNNHLQKGNLPTIRWTSNNTPDESMLLRWNRTMIQIPKEITPISSSSQLFQQKTMHLVNLLEDWHLNNNN